RCAASDRLVHRSLQLPASAPGRGGAGAGGPLLRGGLGGAADAQGAGGGQRAGAGAAGRGPAAAVPDGAGGGEGGEAARRGGGEGERVILTGPQGQRQEIDLGVAQATAPSAESSGPMPEPLCPAGTVVSGLPLPGEQASGVSPLDEGLRRIEQSLAEEGGEA